MELHAPIYGRQYAGNECILARSNLREHIGLDPCRDDPLFDGLPEDGADRCSILRFRNPDMEVRCLKLFPGGA